MYVSHCWAKMYRPKIFTEACPLIWCNTNKRVCVLSLKIILYILFNKCIVQRNFLLLLVLCSDVSLMNLFFFTDNWCGRPAQLHH